MVIHLHFTSVEEKSVSFSVRSDEEAVFFLIHLHGPVGFHFGGVNRATVLRSEEEAADLLQSLQRAMRKMKKRRRRMKKPTVAPDDGSHDNSVTSPTATMITETETGSESRDH